MRNYYIEKGVDGLIPMGGIHLRSNNVTVPDPILQYLSAGADDTDIGTISPNIGTGTLTQGILSQQPSRSSNIISHIQSNNQYWVAGHLAALDFGTADFSTYVKFRTSLASSTSSTLYACGILGGGRNGFGFYVRGSTKEIVFQCRDEIGTLVQLDSADTVNDGNWKIVYVERVSNVWRLYIGNVLDEEEAKTIDLDGSTNDPFMIGGRYNGSSYTGASYDGDWSHIEIYDRALSSAERAKRYNELLSA